MQEKTTAVITMLGKVGKMGRTNQNKGISTVLTTLIIVIASVVLASATTMFGTSLFQTGAQQQSLSVTNVHMWQGTNSTSSNFDTAMVAFVVRNTGDKILAIDSVKVRGATTVYSGWFASNQTETTTTVQALQLSYPTSASPQGVNIVKALRDLDSASSAGNDVATGLAQQAGPVSLAPGKAVILYVILPGSNNASATDDVVSAVDIGAAVTVQVTAGQLSSVQTVNVATNL